MKTIPLEQIRQEVFSLENPEKGKPISLESKPLKGLGCLDRSKAVFADIKGEAELNAFTNLMINVFCIFNVKSSNSSARQISSEIEALDKHASQQIDESTLDKAALKAHKAVIKSINSDRKELVKTQMANLFRDRVSQSNGGVLFDEIITLKGQQSNLRNAISYASEIISTHSAKVIDTSYPHQIISHGNTEETSNGLTGNELITNRSFAVHKKPVTTSVFSFEFLFNGSKTNLFNIIGKMCDESFTALSKKMICACGDSEGVLNDLRLLRSLAHKCNEGNGYSSSQPCLKQLLFPFAQNDMEDEYISITPVPSFAMLHAFKEMERRYFENEDTSVFALNMQKIEVGGANPINAGDYNLSVGGKHPLLTATLPKIKPRNLGDNDDFVCYIANKSSLFTKLHKIDNKWFDRFCSLEGSKSNMDNRRQWESLIIPLVRRSTLNLIRAFNVCDESMSLNCSELEQRFVLGKGYLHQNKDSINISRNEVICDLTGVYSSKILESLKPMFESYKKSQFLFHEDHRDFILAIKTELKEVLVNA